MKRQLLVVKYLIAEFDKFSAWGVSWIRRAVHETSILMIAKLYTISVLVSRGQSKAIAIRGNEQVEANYN